MSSSMLQYSLGNLAGFKKNVVINALPARTPPLTKIHFSMKLKPAGSPLRLADQWRVRAGPEDDIKPKNDETVPEGGRTVRRLGETSPVEGRSGGRAAEIVPEGGRSGGRAAEIVPEGGRRGGGAGGAPLETQALGLGQEFFIAINSKSKEKLYQILSENCTIPGVVYYFPYGGVQNVVNYLSNVMDAMGSSINIVTEKLEFIPRPNSSLNPLLRVNWQLEWINEGKSYDLPLFVGCNEFSFDKVGGKLFISSITGVQEYPVKPRELMLERLPISANSLPKVLKSISSVLDSSPATNKELLQKFQGSSLLLVPLLEILSAYTNNFGG
ncbi:hypothetical protein ACFE04_011854 [Oxalis oulophora]